MKTKLKGPPILVNDGTAICIREPRNGECGLEGYNEGDKYRFQKMSDNKGHYMRVYPNPDTNYYETCGPKVFERFFEEVK